MMRFKDKIETQFKKKTTENFSEIIEINIITAFTLSPFKAPNSLAFIFPP